jgi:hypothetical protein
VPALPRPIDGPIRRARWSVRAPIAALIVSAFSLVPTVAAAASSRPEVPPGFTITKIAALPSTTTNCDDLAFLAGHVFMTCQNMTGSLGGGGNSTILEYAEDGTLITSWSLPDKADGIAGDPLHGRLNVTFNEDGNSHLATIAPSAPSGQQVTNYAYSVNPASIKLTGPLHTGGGTDSVSVDSRGHIYTSASFGGAKTGTAVFKVVLTPPKAATSTGVATLSPTFLDNATASNGNTGAGTVPLKLVDVDSNAIVPATSSRYGGSFVIDDQTAQNLVFAANIDAGTGLTALHTPYGLDDIRWATTAGGTLFVVDKGQSPKGISALYRVTGPFAAGVPYASNDSLGTEVDTVNLKTGKLTPFIRRLIIAKGLVYLDASGAEPALALSGAHAATSVPAASSTPIVPSAKSDSDALPVVLGIVAIALALGFGGLAMIRRPKPAS